MYELRISIMNNVIPTIFLMLMLITSTALLSSTQVSNAQTSNTCKAQPLSIHNVSGSQMGYPPSNAIDNNLNTRWSNPGLGSWITVYSGSGKVICSVDIAWYRGNFRQVDFVIFVWVPLYRSG
jgi:hypothetical protein